MRLKSAYTSVLLVVGLCCDAYGAKNEEVIRYPSLLMTGQVFQSLGVSYSMSQHSQNGSSSTASSLSEKYSLSTTAAILDPHLVSLQLLGGVTYSQQFGSSKLKLFDTDYNLAATAFDMTYHPVSALTSRSTTFVSNGYLPTYSVTSNNNSISAALLNTKVPVQLFYAHTTSDTDGLQGSGHSESESAGLTLRHEIPNLTSTSLSLSTNGARSAESTSAGYILVLVNNLSLDKAHRYQLSSSLDVADSKSAGEPQRNVGLSGDLSCVLGKALFGNLSDRFSYSSSVGFDSETQSQRTNTMAASLSHKLYQSLFTSIAGTYSEGSALGGTTSSYGASGRVSYNKRLVGQSNLNATVELSRLISSQDLQNSQLSVRDEAHFGVLPGERIVPALAGKLSVVASVTSLDGTILYSEGTDYRVDLGLGFIEILTGGNIVPGSDIAISYTVLLNQSISFQTDGVSTSAVLSMQGGRYTLSANYAVRDQTLLSGQANNQELVSVTNLNLNADAHFEETQVGVEYGSVDSTQEESYHVAAYGTRSFRMAHNALVALSVRDAYSVVDATETGNSSFSQNAFSLAASYSRRLFELFNFNTSFAANDTRTSSSYSDFLSLRGALSGNFNQLQFSLSGQLLYRLNGSTRSTDSNVSCSVTRFF